MYFEMYLSSPALDDILTWSVCNASKKLVDICSQQKNSPIALQMACLTLYVVSFQCINTKKQAQLDQNIFRLIFFTTKVSRPMQVRQRQAKPGQTQAGKVYPGWQGLMSPGWPRPSGFSSMLQKKINVVRKLTVLD